MVQQVPQNQIDANTRYVTFDVSDGQIRIMVMM